MDQKTPYLLLVFLQICLGVCAQESDFQQSLQAYRNQQYDSAMWYGTRAVQSFRATGKLDSLVLVHVHRADIVWASQGNWPAIRMADTALAAAARLPEKHLARVAALNKQGQLLVHVSHIEQGRKCLLDAERAIPPGDTINGTVATLFNNISWMYLTLQHTDDALRYAKRSLDIQLTLYGKDSRQLLGVYQSLGLIASNAGRFGEAEKYSMELYRLAHMHLPADHPHMALVHNQLAIVYEEQCRYTEALRHLRSMVDVTQQAYATSGNPQFLAMAYNNTGHLYHQIGEHSLAEAYFEKALRLHKINYGDEEAGIVQPLAHLADAKRMLGKYGAADSLFEEAYRIQRVYGQGNARELADLESQMGDLRYDQGDWLQAVDWYYRALQHYRQAGITETTMVAETKTTLGKALTKLNRTDEALKLHQEVLRGYRAKYPKGNILIAGKLNNISESYLQAGALDKAMRYSDSTFLELLKSPTLSDTNWVKALPFSRHVAGYLTNRSIILEKLYQRNPQPEMLTNTVQLAEDYSVYLERSILALRTQSSLIELAGSQKKLYQAAMDAAWLLADKHGYAEYLAKAFEFAERGKALLLRLAANNLVIDEHAAETGDLFSVDRRWREQISALNAQYLNTGGTDDALLTELTRAIERYRTFQDSVRATGNPRWEARFNVAPLTVAQIQQSLPAKGQTLIEYAVTEHHIYAFVINRQGFEAHRLPRDPIKREVGKLQHLQALGAKPFAKTAHRLYRLLLAPLQSAIKGNRLIVVADAELYGINFEVLLLDSDGETFSEFNYLIRHYDITYLLSASSAMPQRSRQHKSGGNVLFFAPGFTEKMKASYRAQRLDTLAENPTYSKLLRQPFSLQTAKRAVQFVKGELYLEEEAQEGRFRRMASSYRILHMGTHAEANHGAPLQSRLFFAMSLAQDTVDDDGVLHAYEIYSMQLQAELAVLSACNTGSGKFHEGEGVISLAHSFLSAGCASVLMSLWDIDEKTSASLVTEFYRNLSHGTAKSDALRQAKLVYLRHAPDELAHPYYWAGLGLIGDPSPMYMPPMQVFLVKWAWPMIALILLTSGAFYLIRKRQRTRLVKY